MSPLLVGPGCALILLKTQLTADVSGWVEHTQATIAVEGPCAGITLPLPASASLRAIRGKAKLGDGPRRAFGPERWEVRGAEHPDAIWVHTPDLLSGDEVKLEFSRHWPPGPWTFDPGGARYAELLASAPLTPSGSWSPRRGGLWSTPQAGDHVIVADARPAPATPQVLPAAVPSELQRSLELRIPGGDPQVALFPGGGSSTQTVLHLRFSARDAVRSWVMPLPPDASDLQIKAEPADDARQLHADGALAALGRARSVSTRPSSPCDPLLHVAGRTVPASLTRSAGSKPQPLRGPFSRSLLALELAASERPLKLVIRYDTPDVEVCGELSPDLQVSAPGGSVLHEDGWWWLAEVHGRPVMPGREHLIHALDARFRGVALPEPGTPLYLRGRTPDWSLAADLLPALRERVVVTELPLPPQLPRRLIRARRSGLMTPLEATLTLRGFALQMGIDASWALARPANLGPGPDHCPAAYSVPLLRVTLAGQTRWIDPACAVCGPFEIRPELEGADVLTPGNLSMPRPTPGLWRVDQRADEIRWQLQGPPALRLRQWLRSHSQEQLAARVGGPGAALLSLEGADTPGAVVRVLVHNITQPPAPEIVPLAGWLDWVGERSIVGPASVLPDVDELIGKLHYLRHTADGRTTETWRVASRRLSAERAAVLAALRSPTDDSPSPQGEPPLPQP